MSDTLKDAQESTGLMIDIYPWPISEENKHKLQLKYQAMVCSIAKKMINGVGSRLGELDDCIQEGNIGLMVAIERYNPHHANKAQFKTYAYTSVYRYIQRSANNSGIIRIPCGAIKSMLAGAKNGDGLSANVVNQLWPRLFSQLGYTNHAKKDRKKYDYPSEDYIPAKEPVHSVDHDAITVLEKAVECLDPRELEIIYIRYRSGGNTTVTLQKIGDMMGLTRERVRQLEYRAMRKLLNSEHVLKFIDYLKNEGSV